MASLLELYCLSLSSIYRFYVKQEERSNIEILDVCSIELLYKRKFDESVKNKTEYVWAVSQDNSLVPLLYPRSGRFSYHSEVGTRSLLNLGKISIWTIKIGEIDTV